MYKSDYQMTDREQTYYNKMAGFDSIMQKYSSDPNYTNNKQFSADSAIWYFESWFNAKYAYPDEHYSKTQSKTDSLTIAFGSNNLIDMDNIADAENELYNKVKTVINQSSLNNKELLLVNLGITRMGVSDVSVNIITVIAEKTTLTVNYDPFGENDYWYYGLWLGDCDFNNAGTDAAQKISEEIMTNKPIYLPCAGCYFTYSDIEEKHYKGYEFTNDDGEYLIFYIVRPDGNFTPDDKCLNPDEMNFHYHGEETVIYNILEPQLNKSFMNCTLEGKQDVHQSGNARIRHDNKLTFGIRHLIHPGIGFITKEYITD